MFDKWKKKSVSDKTDGYFSGTYPTAHSEEFVPKISENISESSSADSSEIFDFIPQLKGEKYNHRES